MLLYVFVVVKIPTVSDKESIIFPSWLDAFDIVEAFDGLRDDARDPATEAAGDPVTDGANASSNWL